MTLLGAYILITQLRQLGSVLDDTENLLLPFLDLFNLRPGQFVIFEGWVSLLKLLVDSLLEIWLGKVIATLNHSFNRSEFHLFVLLEMAFERTLDLQLGECLFLLCHYFHIRHLRLDWLRSWSCFSLSRSKVSLILSVIHLVEVSLDLNLNIHIEAIIVLLQLSGVC